MLQTLLEMRVHQCNQTASEVGANASNAINKTGEAVNATVSEVGKNASPEGSSLLNQTEEVGKKIIGGAAVYSVI